jgi:hypothetical protein
VVLKLSQMDAPAAAATGRQREQRSQTAGVLFE